MVFSLMFRKCSNVKENFSAQISYDLPLGAYLVYNDNEYVPAHITMTSAFSIHSISLEEAWEVPVSTLCAYMPHHSKII